MSRSLFIFVAPLDGGSALHLPSGLVNHYMVALLMEPFFLLPAHTLQPDFIKKKLAVGLSCILTKLQQFWSLKTYVLRIISFSLIRRVLALTHDINLCLMLRLLLALYYIGL